MAPQCAGLDIALAFAPPTATLAVNGYPRQLEQVLINLLRNAVDAIVERRAAHPNGSDRIDVTLAADRARDGRPCALIDVA